MVDLNKLSTPALSAALRGGTEEWGRLGSSIEHVRYADLAPSKSRRRCYCGCKRRATHCGMANGVALTMGCELAMARWVRKG